MREYKGIVECVVNINHNSDLRFLDHLIVAINNCGARVAHSDRGVDAQRTVLTIISYIQFIPATLRIIYLHSSWAQNINEYSGNHPSVGIVDVVPFVPLRDITMKELKPLIDQWAKEIAAEFNIPIIYYGSLSLESNKKNLSYIRRGGIRTASHRIATTDLKVDHGPPLSHPTLGISCWAVRDVMLAYNVSLHTDDVHIVKALAKTIRDLRTQYAPLQNVRALGWATPHYNCCQISANLYNISEITLNQFFNLVKELSKTRGIEVLGSELIGMTPLRGIDKNLSLEKANEMVFKIGLSYHHKFILKERLLESALNDYDNQDTFVII